ncbi:PQQ-dependent dehydrogenase, methanol/ethanol family [Candidatus Palauibacter sp.]|uniref:PQQ-dependent dehydrogenase, methanol/ethanol family n=1 Tax=Candidatus Palauibacter sp. TaxID=3101350 RepID=UPI003B028BFF
MERAPRGRHRSLSGALLASFALVGCETAPAGSSPGDVDRPRLLATDTVAAEWLTSGRDFGETRYSPLGRIHVMNAAAVGLAWEYEWRSHVGSVHWGLEATPVVVDGVMYAPGSWGSVAALDATTGETVWRYDPDVDPSYSRKGCCGPINRGLEVWEGRVFVGTFDGYLVALDAATGEEIWRVDTFLDRSLSYTSTGSPQIAGDVVVLGNAGGDFGVRGYITAYDLETGEERWRFFTVPGNPADGFEHPELEVAAETWDPNSAWEGGLGGTVWGEMAYDPVLDLLYVGTGNSYPYPIWHRSPSGGDNLYLVSILAIDPKSGRLVWHYQTVPAEIWDYTATQNIILSTVEIDGRPRDVLLQAPKNGFFYVLDRATGELLRAKNFVTVNWTLGIDMETGRPIPDPAADYRGEPRVVFPSSAGGHNWQPMSFNPQTGIAYIPAREQAMLWRSLEEFDHRPEVAYEGFEASWPPFPGEYAHLAEGLPDIGPNEFLLAWDPVAGRELWRVPRGSMWNGGTLVTAGNLVIQGTAVGTLDFHQADSGERLHSIHLGTGVMAGPMTYEVDGVQYVAVMAGYGGPRGAAYPLGSAAYDYESVGRLLVFKLDGGEVPLPPPQASPSTPEPPDLALDAALVRAGAELFGVHCSICHRASDEHLSAYPDLRRMEGGGWESFDAVVLGGGLAANGMAAFGDLLTMEDVTAIRHYLTSEQRRLWEAESAADAAPDAGAVPDR